MLDVEVFLISQIGEPFITLPTIGTNDAFKVYMAMYDVVEGGSGVIRNDFCRDCILAFEQAENNGLSACPSASDAPDTARAEVAFINFDFPFDGRLRLAITDNFFPESRHVPLYGVSVIPRQFRICEPVKSMEKSFTSCRIFCLRNS